MINDAITLITLMKYAQLVLCNGWVMQWLTTVCSVREHVKLMHGLLVHRMWHVSQIIYGVPVDFKSPY